MTGIEKSLERFPRVTLTRLPTPLHYLPHLSEEVGAQIYIKRDDLTDLTLGGDKPRKLEYELARAQEQGADTLVTCGSAQSNHARLTTAAARRLGMQCTIVLSRNHFEEIQGNLLTDYLMGAQVRWVDTDNHWDLAEHVETACSELKQAGKRPYAIPISGTTPLSCLGYVRCGFEIADQMEEQGLHFDAVYTPFGTGGIFTALLLAMRERGIEIPFIGISVNRAKEVCYQGLERWWGILNEMLEGDATSKPENVEVYDEFVGRGYGDATEACLDAIFQMAQSEGILLDPVYSGKVASGLFAHLAAKRWQPEQKILLLHSGGVPALFAYHKEIKAHLLKRGLYTHL